MAAGETGGNSYGLDVRLRLYRDEELVYGKGVSALLRLCGEAGSLNHAARQMGMSYRKALHMVRRAEEGFGRPLLEKTIGGAGGGGSRLTPFGRALVEAFAALEEEAAQFALEQLKNRLPGLGFALKG